MDRNRQALASWELIFDETNNGMRTIKIAFSCTCHPNMKDVAAQITNGFMKFSAKELKKKKIIYLR